MVNGSKKRTRLMKRSPMQTSSRVPRPKLTFDGQMLLSQYYADAPGTSSNIATDYFTVDCANSKAVNTLTTITGLYNTYAYENVKLRWIPKIGPGVADAGTQIGVAYLDNIEKFQNWISLTDANRQTALRLVKNVKFFNAWERVEFTIPITRRRKWFDVNAARTINDSDLDRSTQGAIIVVVNSVNTSLATCGTFLWESKIRLNGLDTGLTT